MESEWSAETAPEWLVHALPAVLRRLTEAGDTDSTLLQLPLAQLRLCWALNNCSSEAPTVGETMGRLSERMGVRQSALTQAADRLIAHGLAERLGDPRDRRVVRLRLTRAGQQWVAERQEMRREAVRRLWLALETGERAALLTAVQMLTAAAMRIEAGAHPVDGGDSGDTKPL
ncbi:MAG: MarR family transcriptional regulator [Armatimonadetes bacterium]|nr:MarR family transcriptional regulator [Armatimonadota bacterium]MDE2208045.1 MarR family transcriptional regulator [Armatimonadota bacterium]